jgi:hypothetical protein
VFRFTIRDVLWLTVVVALAVGWWVEHRQSAARDSEWQNCFQSALTRLATDVQQEPETFDSPVGPWRVHCTVGAHRLTSTDQP